MNQLVVLALHFLSFTSYKNHVVVDVYCYEDNSGQIASLNMEYIDGEFIIDEIVDVSTQTYCTHIDEDVLVTSIESLAWNLNMMYLNEHELTWQDGTLPQSFDWNFDEAMLAGNNAMNYIAPTYSLYLPMVIK